MVSDFFYPNMGGVESHIFQLAQCLLERGHKVIVVTHFYDDRIGVRYMTNFLKVYYLPIVPFYNKSILPTIVGTLPHLRHIFIKENVNIVHGHSAFSSLAHEALFTASLLDIPSVFTDHSLFGFSDASAIVTNSFLKYSLANTSHTICVSHTGKENTVLRSGVAVEKVSVIPNAVDAVKFRPATRHQEKSSHTPNCHTTSTSQCDIESINTPTFQSDAKPKTRSRTKSSFRIDTKPDTKYNPKFDVTHKTNTASELDAKINNSINQSKTIEKNISGIDNTTSFKIRESSLGNNVVANNLYNQQITRRDRKQIQGRPITIVLGSRLVYRKGIDLVAELLPVLCRDGYRHDNGVLHPIHFLIAGDGPKRILIEEIIEKHKLQQCVHMLGELQHSEIRDRLLVRGDIFLNTSLTEAFCMAIVEAVACGLTVVSTNVGGIPEVLPPRYIRLVEPSTASLLAGVRQAVADVLSGRRPTSAECNAAVRAAYCWRDVASRTEVVYRHVSNQPAPSLGRKVRRLWECGPVAGPSMAMVYLFCHYIILLLNWFQPNARRKKKND